MPGTKICDSCRKELAQLAAESNPIDNQCDDLDSSYVYQQDDLETFNKYLKVIGDTCCEKEDDISELSKRKAT